MRVRSVVWFVVAALAATGCVHRTAYRSPAEHLRVDVERSETRYPPLLPAVAETGSLWTEVGAMGLAGDTRASRPGDLVTVRIVEATRGSQEAKTDLNKDAQLSLATPSLAGYEVRLQNKHPNFNPLSILDTSSGKAFAGDGSTSRVTTVVATVTARVLGVYPNGDLAVVGQKDVEVNHERQILTVVGIVRKEDLGPDNTVTSDRIAELGMHLGGRGDINDAQREGWLSRFVQKIWPF